MRTGSVGSDVQKVDAEIVSAMSDIEGKDVAAEEEKLRENISSAEESTTILGSKMELLPGDHLDGVYSFMQKGVVVTEQRNEAFLENAMSGKERERFAFYLDQLVLAIGLKQSIKRTCCWNT